MSHRKTTQQCNKFFENIIKTRRQTSKKYKEMWSHFEPRMKYPLPAVPHDGTINSQHVRPSTTDTKQIHKNPSYNFGILNSKNVPPVTIIDIKPHEVNDYENRKPQVILPVYLRSENDHGSLDSWPNDSILRSADPLASNKKIVAAQYRTDFTNSTNP